MRNLWSIVERVIHRQMDIGQEPAVTSGESNTLTEIDIGQDDASEDEENEDLRVGGDITDEL